MKKLNQKQWGILGTSLGSVLIIVALLTMVGIGSGDTYAATTCTCPDGWTVEGGQCVYRSTQTEKCNDSSCSNVNANGSFESCGATQYDSTRDVYYKQCVSKFTKVCEENAETVVCSAGTYHYAGTSCSSCTSGYYCPGGTFKSTDTSVGGRYKCPENATCTVSSFTCNDGYEPNGSGGCKEKKICAAGSYKTTGDYCTICPVGSYCPGDNVKHDCPSNTQQGQSTCGETCKAGEYRIAGDCVTCTQGSYCPGDGSIQACPTDKPKSNAGSSSVSDCKASSSLACKAGEYRIAGDCVTCTQGSYCPGDGSIQACPTDKPKSNAGSSSVSDCKASGSDTSYVHCDKGWFYTGDGKTCTKCPSGSWCPGGNFPSTSLIRDGGVKCPDDRPYSEPGSDEESDCKASGNGGADPSNPSSSGGGGGNGGNGGSSGGNGGNSGGSTGGNTSGNSSNTNTNPSTATKTPLVIVIIGMVAMGLGTFTYYKSKNNEI